MLADTAPPGHGSLVLDGFEIGWLTVDGLEDRMPLTDARAELTVRWTRLAERRCQLVLAASSAGSVDGLWR